MNNTHVFFITPFNSSEEMISIVRNDLSLKLAFFWKIPYLDYRTTVLNIHVFIFVLLFHFPTSFHQLPVPIEFCLPQLTLLQ